jgi:hypothetical protein
MYRTPPSTFNLLDHFNAQQKLIFASVLLIAAVFLVQGCRKDENDTALFSEMPADRTGISFENTVVQEGDNNVLTYPYYFNGGGVAIGDINNDGLDDIFFTGNQVAPKLYLNKGDFDFEDITEKAGVGVKDGWKTGVAMADVNLDGFLDIYVCRSAMADSVLRKNLLFINNGDLTFTEKADDYGVGDNSYSTQAAFFDYDRDGDVDLFVLNHSLPRFAGFNNMLVNNKHRKAAKFNSKLFRNDKGYFTEVSEEAGIVNNVLSFGLGIAVSDLNDDGWPDMYISNDFNEEDYLYINKGDGTFTEDVRGATGHVSLFSMGSDIADVNNDARPDIFTLDMMPESNERIKLSSGDDNYDKYRILVASGFHHQSMRNMLQLNNGDGTFSEIGQLMGISNTDWSWAALFSDFDGDGWKDLFVSNGYEKDYTNMQFLKFTMDEKIKSRQTGASMDLQRIINQMPSIQEGNVLFRNNGDMTFARQTESWGLSRKFKSNGAAYGDLDNDGDPDLVINALNEKAVVYRNSAAGRANTSFLKIDLQKENRMRIITGTKVCVYAGGVRQYQEFSPVRGFQSCMYVPIVFGTAGQEHVDSVRVIWPDQRTQLLKNVITQVPLAPKYQDATADYVRLASRRTLFEHSDSLNWRHHPVDTIDFKRQLLLPKIFSYSGPHMAKGDVNNDGLQDVYLCGARHQPSALFVQTKGGGFTQTRVVAFDEDREHQDEDAVFFDADSDGDLDLYVVSGGYLFNENNPLLQDRLYLNDGKGNFRKAEGAIPTEALAGSCVVAFDVDLDGDQDLFVGSRLVPGRYPEPPQGMLLVNDGKGKFAERMKSFAPELENIGMVCDALAVDINQDKKQDLIIAGDWAPVKIYMNEGGKLKDRTQTWLPQSGRGWWNCVVSEDFDADGDQDLMVGNYGLNTQFKVSDREPATLVYKDFDHDGSVDPFFCYYINGVSYPYASRDEALGQVSMLKQRFPDYNTYSNAKLEDIFKPAELEGSITLKADELRTLYLENKGGRFEARLLPVQAQFSPVYAMATLDMDADGDQDVIMGGNDTYMRVRIGKTDANRGTVLFNDGKGNFEYLLQTRSGLDLQGDTRSLLFIDTPKGTSLLAGATGEVIHVIPLRK